MQYPTKKKEVQLRKKQQSFPPKTKIIYHVGKLIVFTCQMNLIILKKYLL